MNTRDHRNMGTFKMLISGLLLGHSRRALPLAAAAAVSIGAAFACSSEWDHATAEHASGIHDGEPSVEKRRRPRLGRALPPDHPDTVRVRRVAANLIAAARRDEFFGQRRLSERIGRRLRLDVVDWKVGVIEDKSVRACSNRTGEIMVFTGLLERVRNDAEIATVLGHKVAHVVARHGVERKRKRVLVGALVNFVAELLDVPPGGEIQRGAWMFLFMRPCYFRTELEADRVGIMLQAAAGYDPRAGPRFQERLGRGAAAGRGAVHPPWMERASLLRRADVMDAALEVFRDARARRVRAS